MMHKTLLVDVDGVCLRWLPAFERHMIHRGFKANHNPHAHYELGSHFGIDDPDEMNQYIKEFNEGTWEFGTLPPVDGAVDGISRLVYEGYRLVAISACSVSDKTMALRRANLYNVFGDVFADCHLVPLKASKAEFLTKYESTFWIEDKHSAAVEGLELGHKSIIMDYTYNREPDPEGLYRATVWNDAVEYILNNQ